VCETCAEVLGIKDGIRMLSELSVWRQRRLLLQSSAVERVRVRVRVRDERGVHSYNSCACSKKASSSIRTNNIGI
jgi:hypothetical protein